MKAYRVTPSWRADCESIIVPSQGSWRPALDLAQEVLESLFLKADEEGRPWSDIGPVTIECIEISDAELAELAAMQEGLR